MRLDKFLSETGTLSRKETANAVRRGLVSVNGTPARNRDDKINPETDEIRVSGTKVEYKPFVYIMMNKPEGYVCATEDKSAPFVTQLLDESYAHYQLFPAGRLDKYTLGFLLLTNDGKLAHELLSPRHHAEKVYRFKCERPLERTDELEAGVYIEGGYLTKPCKVKKISEYEGEITLIEGKYHQIKQMLWALGNRITYLERISFAGVPLDKSLLRGEYRELTAPELKMLKNNKTE